jgi:porin
MWRWFVRSAIRVLAASLVPAAVSADALHEPRVLGDLGGVRSRLERVGVGVQLFYNQYVSGNPRGGANPRSVGHSGSYDFFARIDAEELLGWRSLTALLHVKGQYDRNINADVRSISLPIDDADFDEPIYVDELWFEQGAFDERVRLRAGFLEQQTVFDRNAYANSEDRQFLSTFLDNNPLVPLPNGLGAVLLVRPLARLTLAAGVADADNVPRSSGFGTAFDGFGSLTGYLEAAFDASLPAPGRPLPGTWRVGVFLDGRERDALSSGRTKRGHLGAYLSMDQLVLRERGAENEGLGVFARVGWADGGVAPLEWFWSLGGRYRGLVPGRGRDELGVAAYQAIGAKQAPLDRETGIELYYRIEVFPWLAVTPDLQWIFDPGARGAHEDALVTTMRFRVTF